MKLAKPGLKVIVIMGDGDAVAIGGNHFIHAARRNIDVTSIILNNSIYGMTGGQSSPTTPYGMRSSTTIYSSIEQAFKISELAVTAGAVFEVEGQKNLISSLQSQVDQVSESIHFAGANCVSNCAQWNERQREKQQQVEQMKSQLEDQKKRLEEMQDQARQQGFGSSVYDPD